MARCWLTLAGLLALARAPGAAAADPPECPLPARCKLGGYGQNEYPYTVDGLQVMIQYTDSGYFALKCPKNITLDNPALPRFKSKLRVSKAQLEDCPAPRDSYADALERLNVLVLDKLKLVRPGALRAAHLAPLGELPALELVQASLAPGALQPLRGLQRLALDGVRLPPGELARLPPALQALHLARQHQPVRAADLAALPRLANLTVRDSEDVPVEPPPGLRALALEMPAPHVAAALPAGLESLTLFGWDAAAPEPWAPCGLRELYVRFPNASSLPAGWLAACADLASVRVEDGERLTALHATALHGAALRELRVTSCALAALPAGLLDAAPDLLLLDLSDNRLTALPGGLFVVTKKLRMLNLSRNRLTTNVFDSLAAVTSLTTLNLSFNDLKDSCGGAADTVRGSSPLQYLTSLEKFYLRKTNTSVICQDWRTSMSRLKELDLSYNNISVVTFTDLRFSSEAEVDLRRNPVARLEYSRDDVSRAAAVAPPLAAVRLDPLPCDCRAHWAAEALRSSPQHLRVAPRCAGGALLGATPAHALLCAAPCAAGCACGAGAAGAAPRVLRVQCAGAGLQRAGDAVRAVSRALAARGAAAAQFEWRLLLPHNNISELEIAELPANLSVLDLSDNKISVLKEEVVQALVQPPRRLFLARNPLDCSCSHAAALAALRPPALADLPHATCAGGTPLLRARPRPCAGLPVPAVAAAAALLALLAAAALAAALWRPALRLRIKAALHQRGWLAPAEPDDDGRRFDVFVSFAHADEHFVRTQLLVRLEAPPAPYRVCVHYRDWAPGGWIPAQIAASVRASRRTLAVVSEHFLRSGWARAELREAYALALRDARPRLLVLLLAEPAALPLDATLRRYLAANTYLQWGDPWLWHKLRLALPPARGPAPPAPEREAGSAAALDGSGGTASSSCSSAPAAEEPSGPGPGGAAPAGPELARLLRGPCAAPAAAVLPPCTAVAV
nr:protein toll [Helicoverpa armigera]XP_049692894.1 protein toll [Helicoverpa armigera]XP_049692895.1 protein toll [Helicoverpa armigera]